MSKPEWVINDIKYNRAVSAAQNPSDEKEVKKLYVSYGGLLTNIVVENEPTNEIESTPEVVVEEATEEVVSPEEIETIETIEESTEELEEVQKPKRKKLARKCLE